MHECRRSERRLTRITEVGKPSAALSQSHRVLRRQLHPQIMRMLSIDERLAPESFPSLKEQRRTATRKREWLKAEHPAQLQGPFAELVKSHRHKPISRFEFGDTSWPTLCVYSDDRIVVKHQEPVSGLFVHHVRRRGVWLP